MDIDEQMLKDGLNSSSERPTIREILEEQAVFRCPNCGEPTQLDAPFNVDQVNISTVKLETECCDYEQHFIPKELDDLIPASMGDYDVLTDVSGVSNAKANALIDAGYATVNDLREASQMELSDVNGIGNALSARIKADVGDEAEEVVEAVSKGEGGSCPVDTCPASPTEKSLYDHMIAAHGWYTEDLEVE